MYMNANPTTPPQKTNRLLDQFYTKPEVAISCMRSLVQVAKRMGVDWNDYWFVEPSAGCGCFYQTLPPRRRIGIDIDPKQTTLTKRGSSDKIVRANYLQWSPPLNHKHRQYIVIGNPPFGKRGKLAVAFFNHSDFADIIAFIVPVSFRKYRIHRQLSAEYALVARKKLARDSFCTPDLKEYAINSEFHIWTRKLNPQKHTLKNMRETTAPPIAHNHFKMRQYNNTEKALKAFDAPFDFAVPCQGYQDYTRRESKTDMCEKNKQWLIFNANNKRALKRLMTIDYQQLAWDTATATPGFRKNDVVKCYVETLC